MMVHVLIHSDDNMMSAPKVFASEESALACMMKTYEKKILDLNTNGWGVDISACEGNTAWIQGIQPESYRWVVYSVFVK